jgi:hypothetical protein
MAKTRVAVLGLYSSGSTAVAGCLHHLGVVMGHQFWGNYYEPAWLSAQLRAWWDEPRLVERVGRADRVRVLREWVEGLERTAAWVGAKHPLLCLCGPDLVEAWGADVRFVWAYRPLENSIRSLERRGWWPDAGAVQRRLWHAVTEFLADREHLRVEFADLMDDPARQVRRVADFLGLEPSAEQVAAAVASIRPTSTE